MKKPIIAYRHGDVLLIRRKKMPDDYQPVHKKGGRNILAEGEVTGHAHVATGDCLLAKDATGSLWLRADGDNVSVTHEEHKEIGIEQGVYEIRIQREYEPEGWRYVAD